MRRLTASGAVFALAVAAALAGGSSSGPAIPPVTFRDVTQQSGIRFVHNNGAFGKKFLP
jgi:hypothetical protein